MAVDAPLSVSYASSRWFSSHWNVSNVNSRYLQYSFVSSNNISQQLEALNGLYARAYFLMGVADQVAGGAYQNPTRSSNPDVVGLTAYDNTISSPADSPDTYQFQVYQLAQNQVNQGTALDPEAASAVNTGTNTFTLTVGGVGYNLSVAISAGDTNETALNKLAQAINAAGTGVTADLVRSDTSLRLLLTGPSGAAHAFSLADTVGNAVTASGADTATQAASDAQYLLNGTLHTQETNDVSLLNGQIQVTLKDTGRATVTAGPSSLDTTMESLVGAMNGFSSYVSDNAYLADGLVAAWSDQVGRFAATLGKYGLESGQDLQLGLNTRTLSDSLANQPVATLEAITGKDGLAPAVSSFMANILMAPGASLLNASPYADATAQYRTATPWFQVAASSFSQVV